MIDFLDTYKDLIIILIQLIGFILVIITILLTKRQLSLNKKIHIENLIWEKTVLTDNILKNRGSNKYFVKLKIAFDDFVLEGINIIPLEVIQEKIESDKEIQADIHSYLNLYTRICRGYYYDIYNKDLIDDSLKFTMVKIYHNYSKYIEFRRKIHNPNLWIYLEKYYNDNKLNLIK